MFHWVELVCQISYEIKQCILIDTSHVLRHMCYVICATSYSLVIFLIDRVLVHADKIYNYSEFWRLLCANHANHQQSNTFEIPMTLKCWIVKMFMTQMLLTFCQHIWQTGEINMYAEDQYYAFIDTTTTFNRPCKIFSAFVQFQI